MGLISDVAKREREVAMDAQIAAMNRDWQEQQQARGARGTSRYEMPVMRPQMAPSNPHMEGLAGEATRQQMNRDFNETHNPMGGFIPRAKGY